MLKFAIAAVLACTKQVSAQAPSAKDAGWWTPDAERSPSPPANTLDGAVAERSLSTPSSTVEGGKAEAKRSLSGVSGRPKMPKPPARFLQRFSDPEIEEREPGDLVYDEGKRALLELPEKDMTKLQRLLLAPPLGQDSHGPRLGARADAFSRLLRFWDPEIEEREPGDLVYGKGKRALLELPEEDMTKLQRLLLAPPLGQDSHGPRLGAGADAFSRLLQRFPDSEIEELEQALLELPEEDMTKLHRLLWAPPMKKVEEWR